MAESSSWRTLVLACVVLTATAACSLVGGEDRDAAESSSHTVDDLCEYPKSFLSDVWGAPSSMATEVYGDRGTPVGLQAFCTLRAEVGLGESFEAFVSMADVASFPPEMRSLVRDSVEFLDVDTSDDPARSSVRRTSVVDVDGSPVQVTVFNDGGADVRTERQGWQVSLRLDRPPGAGGDVGGPTEQQQGAAATFLVTMLDDLRG